MERISVLFVCLGNICRSPTAEAVFRKRAVQAGLDVHIESAGTSAWHEGEKPDARSQETGVKRGYSFNGQESRKVHKNDFVLFDHIIAMDRKNLDGLKDICPPALQHKVQLFMDFAPHASVREVPDPYYGGADGFDNVLDLIEQASDGLIERLNTQSLPKGTAQ
ncbi:MAG: low molecular weight protein-tyrosine-phosphatase [Maricaulaceae bacterium]